MKIETNLQYLQLAAAGKCGNAPRIWLSLDEAITEKNQPNSFFVSTTTWNSYRLYHQSRSDLLQLRGMALAAGGMLWHPTRSDAMTHVDYLYLMENPPIEEQEKHVVFQCDWWPHERWLKYGLSNQPWGKTKREGVTRIAEGLTAELILRHYLAEHREDLRELEETYPTAIIECTLFPFRSGIYNRNLLIWECRDY